MNQALEEQVDNEPLLATLKDSFFKIADHMRNQQSVIACLMLKSQ
jgi:hypothetical protein